MEISANTQKHAVIFDLGGVLLREAEVNLHKADSSTLKSVLGDNKPEIKIFNRAFKFAALFHGSDVMHRWILGTISETGDIKITTDGLGELSVFDDGSIRVGNKYCRINIEELFKDVKKLEQLQRLVGELLKDKSSGRCTLV